MNKRGSALIMVLSRTISLETLVALNDEIAALSRAGVPLERGLRAIASDMPGRLGRLADGLAEGLERGEDLAQVLQRQGAAFPPVYRAVVLAGLQSGRLPAALEGISTTARQLAEVRRGTLLSLVYPLLVLLVATSVFAVTMLQTAPQVAGTYLEWREVLPWWYQWQLKAANQLFPMLPWLWGLVFIGLAAGYLRAYRASSLAGRQRWWKPYRLLRYEAKMAVFAELMALMVEQQVPLSKAVALAGEATGDAAIAASAGRVAQAVEQGRSDAWKDSDFPPLLTWQMTASQPQQQLGLLLRGTAAAFRRRARERAQWLMVFLPLAFSAGIGGLATLGYVLLVLAPFYDLLLTIGSQP